MKVFILAGGMGTRLSEETDIRPKPMLEIGGRPMLCAVSLLALMVLWARPSASVCVDMPCLSMLLFGDPVSRGWVMGGETGPATDWQAVLKDCLKSRKKKSS